MSYFNMKRYLNAVRKRAPSVSSFRITVYILTVMILLPINHIVYAKDKPDKGKQAPPSAEETVNVHGNVRGFEKARKRGDGAFVIPGHIKGKGKVIADHVVFEGIVSPGNSPGCIDFSGDVTFSSTATLIIELGGVVHCSEYDQINVVNTLTINNASFELVLINGYVPQFGDSFNVLSWGSLSGSGFSTIDTSAAALPHPLQWDMSQLYVSGGISVGVINIADGDLAPFDNPDDLINAADLMIATQLALDQRVAGPLQYAHGDMNNDGDIDVVDLLLIQQLVMQN